MTQPIIEVKNLSKEYIISHNVQPYYTLRDSLMQLAKKPFQIFSKKNTSNTKEKFLALNDVSFSVMPGEVIGIIGRNGAGKSTLLKILSQITPPSKGSIHLRGRVASLLEVGTGFHAELTGRENIFLNGAILGMTQKEIKSKFDEIVEFSGVEKFLDTPVKRYSSGMYVRLAFAVAAHLEPEILIVDEVLAVGDAEFQKKCLGKMSEVSSQGRTVIFVSHNMNAIKQLCQRVILLEKGAIKKQGSGTEIIEEYLELGEIDSQKNTPITFSPDVIKRIEISEIRISKNNSSKIDINEDFIVEIDILVREQVESVFISLIFFDQNGCRCTDFMEIDSSRDAIKNRLPGIYKLNITVPGIFNAGTYSTMITIEKGQETIDKQNGPVVVIVDNLSRIYPIQGRASIISKAKWNYL